MSEQGDPRELLAVLRPDGEPGFAAVTPEQFDPRRPAPSSTCGRWSAISSSPRGGSPRPAATDPLPEDGPAVTGVEDADWPAGGFR